MLKSRGSALSEQHVYLQVTVSGRRVVRLLAFSLGFTQRVPASNLVLFSDSSREWHTGWKSCACWKVLRGWIFAQDRAQMLKVIGLDPEISSFSDSQQQPKDVTIQNDGVVIWKHTRWHRLKKNIHLLVGVRAKEPPQTSQLNIQPLPHPAHRWAALQERSWEAERSTERTDSVPESCSC